MTSIPPMCQCGHDHKGIDGDPICPACGGVIPGRTFTIATGPDLELGARVMPRWREEMVCPTCRDHQLVEFSEMPGLYGCPGSICAGVIFRPCTYCGQQTRMGQGTPTQGRRGAQRLKVRVLKVQCTNCWEVSTRIGSMPQAAVLKILEAERKDLWPALLHWLAPAESK